MHPCTLEALCYTVKPQYTNSKWHTSSEPYVCQQHLTMLSQSHIGSQPDSLTKVHFLGVLNVLKYVSPKNIKIHKKSHIS